MTIDFKTGRLYEELVYIDPSNPNVEYSTSELGRQVISVPSTHDLTKSDFDQQYRELEQKADKRELGFHQLKRLDYIRQVRLEKKSGYKTRPRKYSDKDTSGWTSDKKRHGRTVGSG